MHFSGLGLVGGLSSIVFIRSDLTFVLAQEYDEIWAGVKENAHTLYG